MGDHETCRGDYVLGTDDAELERLGLQHRVWRPYATRAWQRAGVTVGSRVLDVGAGPGYATLDLAEVVTPTGSVVALERSERFVRHARERCESRGLAHVELHEVDLMAERIPAIDFDVAWVRWVSSFVSSPDALVEKLAEAVLPGGRVVFHEYADYAAWRFAPTSTALEEFVRHVMEAWRVRGCEPDVALRLPEILDRHGFRVRSAKPLEFCIGPGDPRWSWPMSFVEKSLERIESSGRADREWVSRVRSDLRRIEAHPSALMLTPMVLELIAERRADDVAAA